MISETTCSSQTKLIGLNLHVSEHGIGYSNLTPDPQGTLQENRLVSVISWYTGENLELKWILNRNIPRFCANQNFFLPIVFVNFEFEKFALMWRHFFIKIEKNNFSLTFLPDLLTSNGSGKLILKLSQTKPFLAF